MLRAPWLTASMPSHVGKGREGEREERMPARGAKKKFACCSLWRAGFKGKEEEEEICSHSLIECERACERACVRAYLRTLAGCVLDSALALL